MNQNPWFVEQAAHYQRQQIRHDVHEIRLAQKALKADVVQTPGPNAHSLSRRIRPIPLALLKAVLVAIGL